MNIRQKYELKVLINEGKLDISKMSDDFNLSPRTVRYDLEIISKYLNDFNGTEFYIKKNFAVLNLPQNIKQLVLDELSEFDFYLTKLSADERMVMIIFDLCWENKESKIENLCDKYFVSRSTINNDIAAIKLWSKENNINFQSTKGKGIRIVSSQKENRDIFSKLIRLYESIKKNYEGPYLSNEIVKQWFPDIDTNKIGEIIQRSEEKYSYWLTDIAFEALTIHIAMAIKRYKMNRISDEHQSSNLLRIDSIQYVIASNIIYEINKIFDIELNDQEVYYVAIHIGAKPSSKIEIKGFEHSYLEFGTLDLIYRVSKKININLRDDEKLYNGLLQHFNASSIRLKQKMLIANPLKDELMNDYIELYDAIKISISELDNQELLVLTEDEICYVLLHFAASITRIQARKINLANILIVCSTGVGTAELLLTNINRYFVYGNVQTASEHSLKSLENIKEFDFIVSTIQLSSDLPVIVVSPLLKEKDIVEIRNLMLSLNLYTGTPSIREGKHMNQLAKHLFKLIDDYSSIEKESELSIEILDLASKLKRNNNLNKQGGKIVLSSLLIKEHMELNVICSDWIDAIKKSGELLVKDQCITEEYISAVVENVKEVGPYIVITKGVALPHASNEKGVNKTSMSLITLSNPINFGNKNNDPVEFVFMLAPKDSKSHLRALSDLAEILGRKEFLNLLKGAKTVEEILSYIEANESK